MVLVGVHPVFTHVPPNSLRSTIATFIPASLKRPARDGPACPVPTMIASYAFDINHIVSGELFDLKYGLDHDRCADGCTVHAVYDPNVSRLSAEKLHKEVRGAIRDRGVVNKFLRCRYENRETN